MGIVFEARQRRLDRRVAIKILRPELATAVAAERFLAEGRILARLSHPNIVPIYDAGEADGLLYYVMEFVEGESLADRLRRGPLPPAEALRLSQDLLAALGAAHAQGMVHRDVKPANIFLRQGQALLGDFGIARWRQEHDAGLTTPGELIGTPRYMSPEQRDGVPVTMRTDVYAAGLVLWEACTGKRWPAYQAPEAADWRGVPAALVSPLRKALALNPAERWSDAGELAGALERSRGSRRWPWVAGAAGVAAVLAVLLWPPRRPSATELVLEIASMETPGAPSRAPFADSVVRELVSSLSGYPDLAVYDARGRRAAAGAVQLAGSATFSGDSLRLELGPIGSGRREERAGVDGVRSAWPSLVRSLADSMLGLVWKGRIAGEKFLPFGALPRSGIAFNLWHHAERLYAQGAWDSAEAAYIAAEQEDSTCLLCSYRLLDIDRWLAREQDTARLTRVHAQIDVFPEHYRALIAAQAEPWPARYQSLKQAATDWPEFALASFLLGDEIFHRGPLYGLRRYDALEPMQKTVDLRPDFAPGWEHLAWLLLSEGDSLRTKEALDSVPHEPAGTGLSMVLRMMLELGFQWRFGSPQAAAAASENVLSNPLVESDFRAPAGGRIMMTVDAPRGAVGLGRALERRRMRPEALHSGLVAQAHGWAALGRPDSLHAVAERLRRGGYQELALYALSLEGALALFDPDSLVTPDSRLLGTLAAYLGRGAPSPGMERRAAWMLGLLALREGDTLVARRFRLVLGGESAPARLRTQLDLMASLRGGDSIATPALLALLVPSDLRHGSTEPLEDAVSRLLRAQYAERDSGWRAAANQLRWHEHLQLNGFPVGDPQAGEAAWALGTLIRWRRAQLLENMGQADTELCAAYAAVARLWKDAAAPYAARADSARRQYDVHRCVELR